MTPLGQHFLKNRAVVLKIIAALELKKGDRVIEIGPGHGELTLPLAKACAEVGARLIAIEKDKRLAARLAETLPKTVDLRNADILALLRAGTLDRGDAEGDTKLVGNIPYYITGKLLRAVGEIAHKPERSIFMLQKEVAERIAAQPPRMNRLAASVQFSAEPIVIARVPREDFLPQPKVDAAVIALTTKKSSPTDPARYYRAVRALFAQPRKTIVNNLLAAKQKTMAREELANALRDAGAIPEARPQDLTVANIASIAKLLF